MSDSIFDQEAITGGTEPDQEIPPAALGDTFQELEEEAEKDDVEEQDDSEEE
jgi:hypothetical protein